MSAGEPKKKDIWDKFDILAKGVLVLMVSAGIGFYTTVIQEENRIELSKQQLFSNEAETLIRIFNQREISDSTLRSNIFKVLLEHFFSKEDPESQIVALQMIGLNFVDALQIKPMFYYLDRQISQEGKDEFEEEYLKNMLRGAANTIIQNQLLQIENAEGGAVCEITLTISDDPPPRIADCFDGRAFKLTGINSDSVTVQPYIIEYKEGDGTAGEFNTVFKPAGDGFSVTYYDMPLIDYTRLPLAKTYFSLALLRIQDDSDSAKLALATLPNTEFSSRGAFNFDEKVNELFIKRHAEIEEGN